MEDKVESHEPALNMAAVSFSDGISLGSNENGTAEPPIRTFTGTQSESTSIVLFVPSHLLEEITPASPIDTGACPIQDRAELVEIASTVIAEDSILNTSVLPVQRLTEVAEVPPTFAAENSPMDPSLRSTQEETEKPEIASAAVADDSLANTSVLPVQPVAEIARTLAADNSPIDTSVLPTRKAARVIEIAPALVTNHRSVDPSALSVQPATQEVAQSLPVTCAKEEPRSPSLLAFYGLSEQAFQATPDPAYLYLSQVHQEALTSLAQGIQDLRGFMALIAEPGMGKTTLLNKLMEDLHDSARTVFLFQTQCNSRELLRYLLGELGVKHAGMDAVAMHRALNEILFQEMLHGRRFVLIVDEAQNLDESVLETIRLLSDFETSHRKLIQIVLAGQPQLVDTLLRPSLAQLRQRIAVLANLESLSVAETSRYVEHRLRAAGSSAEPIFTQEALERIAELSQGTPRSINNLCFNALLSGHAQGTRTIDLEIVQKVGAKLDLSSLRRPRQDRSGAQHTPRVVPGIPSQLSSVPLTALARGGQSDPREFNGIQSKEGITLIGKLTEKLRSRSWGKENEFRIQVSLERESSSDIPVADRYYCCSFYISEGQADVLRVGQPVTMKIQYD
jgi:type II secretory pathway predicted ATPase ExeA